MSDEVATARPGLPVLRWTATSRWRAGPGTLVVLVVGLWLFGPGEAALVAAHLGNSPWTVLAQGVARHSPLSIGQATLAISAAVLLAWIPLRERPGLGTIANAVLIAVAIDFMLRVLPQPTARPLQLAEVVAAVALIGVGSALYLTTHLGPGPRDGWMTALHRRTGLPISRIRLALEVTSLAGGWLLGGRVGLGTLLFALLVGQALRIALTGLVRIRCGGTAPSGGPTDRR